MIYYLGVDAGGTSTRFALFDDTGSFIEALELESIHYMKVDDDLMKERLLEAKNHFEEKYNFDSIKVAMGIAGYGGDPQVRKRIERVVHQVFPKALISNDAKFAMISALNNKDGVYIISGTGSIAFRRHKGLETRRGGYGYLVGDEGSGFWIGKRILEQFTQEADGRLEKTACYTSIMSHFNLKDPYEIVTMASSQKSDYRTWCASLAGLLRSVESCQEIYYEAGRELSRLANSFNITGETSLAFGGSVLSNHKTVQKGLLEHLDKNYSVLEQEKEIEYSAYLQFKGL